MALRTTLLRLALIFSVCTRLAHAEAAPFDLLGPKMDVRVERSGKTLPIADVPNLLPGDRLWIHPDLPDTQSAHYLMIVAFLRGATNPPPENWFTRADAWNKKVHEEGVFVTVPKDAEQALIFLAPETGGDYATLRNAVRGRPGVFVRAAQDLNIASLDRARLDKYLAAIQQTVLTEPDQLEQTSKNLARSLVIKIDPNCFDKPAPEQAACLTAHTDQLVLNDGHTQTMVSSVTSGAAADLVTQITATPTAGAGYFSPYVGAIIDMVRILDNLHTAEYQYIPALAVPQKDTLNLKLNNPPSFKNPKSVIVIGLPPIQPPQFPPLRAVNPKQTYCLQNPTLVLPVEGAPLVFATGYAHDVALHINSKKGQDLALPVNADAVHGGYAIDSRSLDSVQQGDVTGELRGMWGFEPFTGPKFRLVSAHPQEWKVAPTEQSALVVGRLDTLHLRANDSACVMDVAVRNEKGERLLAAWNLGDSGSLDVKVQMEDAPPGPINIAVKQFGLESADHLKLQAFSEAAHLDGFSINAGDQQGVMRGTRLDQVAGLDLNGMHFSPGELKRAHEQDELHLSAAKPTGPLQPEQPVKAQVELKDGRTLPIPATVTAPRPKVSLISKSVQLPSTPGPTQVHLTAPEELPQDARLSFSFKSEIPASFPRSETIEIATQDASLHTSLSIADGSLTLADTKTVVASIDLGKQLGPSAFGPLQFRPVDESGAAGDWQPLVDLVRLPTLTQLKCPRSVDKQCVLSGSNLFLIDSIASDPQFARSVTVPDGFADLSLNVPHPDATHTLYIKLRDDPTAINTAQLPIVPDTQQATAPLPAATPPAQPATTPLPTAPQNK